MGVMTSPFWAKIVLSNPYIFPAAFGITSFIFGSASLYAYTRPSNSLLSWHDALYSGLLGLIGI